MKLPISRAIARMPADRDVALDVIRSWSLIVVVFGHFLMSIVYWQPDHVPVTSNMLSSGRFWPYATWLLQVMPLFFVAGGAVNYQSWVRHSGSWSEWLYHRFRRLMRPTLVFLAVMMAVFTVVTLAVPQKFTDPLLIVVGGPLWFLAVYLPVVALTPLTVRWFRRSPVTNLVTVFVVVVAVDVLRLTVHPAVGLANLVFAWTLVYELGYLYLRGVSRRTAWLFVGGGLLGNALLTTVFGWYPRSMVGIPTERFSNVGPPTVALMLHAFFLFGVFCLLAPWLRRVFSGGKPLRATVAAGMLAMSVYLWHLFVLVVMGSGAHLLGVNLPTRLLTTDSAAGTKTLVVPDGLQYWLWIVPFAVVYGLVVYWVARTLWPVEYLRLPLLDRRPNLSLPTWLSGAGVALTAVGLLGFALTGFSGFPFATHSAWGLEMHPAVCLAAIFAGSAFVALAAPRRRRNGNAG